MNKNSIKTLIKQPDWRKTTPNCRVIDSVWLLFLLSTHTRPPTYFAGNPYTAHITGTIILLSYAHELQ